MVCAVHCGPIWGNMISTRAHGLLTDMTDCSLKVRSLCIVIYLTTQAKLLTMESLKHEQSPCVS